MSSPPTGSTAGLFVVVRPDPRPHRPTRGARALLPRLVGAGIALIPVLASAQVEPPGPGDAPPDPLRILAASIEEREVEVGAIRGRVVTAWIEPGELPSCDAKASVRYGFLFDPLESRHALPDTTRPFTPDARLEIACDVATGQWAPSFGEIVPRSESPPGRLEVGVPVEDLPGVDLLWIAYATDGERAWFLPDPGADALGPTARFSIYEIAKW